MSDTRRNFLKTAAGSLVAAVGAVATKKPQEECKCSRGCKCKACEVEHRLDPECERFVEALWVVFDRADELHEAHGMDCDCYRCRTALGVTCHIEGVESLLCGGMTTWPAYCRREAELYRHEGDKKQAAQWEQSARKEEARRAAMSRTD
jgi:hypothetical protein